MKKSDDSSNVLKPRELRLDRLLGRQVLGRNNRPAGRLEEFRAEIRGQDCVITEVLLGAAGLFERLGIGMKLVFGRSTGGYLARWNQLDFSDPESLRLSCTVEELRTL
jgi:hypothetical protein